MYASRKDFLFYIILMILHSRFFFAYLNNGSSSKGKRKRNVQIRFSLNIKIYLSITLF